MIDLIKEYGIKRLELLKMEATEKASTGSGITLVIILASVFLLFFMAILNIAAGFLIGHALGNYGYGFLIVAGFYLLLFVLVLILRKSIKNGVANKIIKLLNS